MIATILRAGALLASLVLLISFSLFAIDQAGGASQQAQAEAGVATARQAGSELGPTGAQTVGPALRGAGAHNSVRATIDDVNRTLVSPLHPLAPGTAGSWGQRSFELAGGLLLYGLILGIVARSAGLARVRRGQAPGPPQPHF